MTAAGGLSWEIVLGAAWHIVEVLMNSKDWSYSFSAVGLADEQRKISARTQRKLQLEPTALAVGRTLPTLSDLRYIFPKGAIIPIHELFLAVERFSEDSLQRTFMLLMLHHLQLYQKQE